MSEVIELLDSDDDIADQEIELPGHLESIPEHNPTHAPAEADSEKGSPGRPLPQNTTLTSETVTNDGKTLAKPVADSPAKHRARHRRKSVHQPMRFSPDMQFETISLDDEDDDPQQVASSPSSQAKAIPKKHLFKTTPKILGVKPPTKEELLDSALDEFLNNEDVNSIMRKIAGERVRINYLLASYGMPDITFSLNTQYERLKFQFEDRLKQRKMRSWNMTRMLELKTKNRSMQQEK